MSRLSVGACFSFLFVQIQHLPIFYLPSSVLRPSYLPLRPDIQYNTIQYNTIQYNTEHSVPSSHNSNTVVIQHNQIYLLRYLSIVPAEVTYRQICIRCCLLLAVLFL